MTRTTTPPPPETRAAVVLAALAVAEADRNADMRVLDAKHCPIIGPLEGELKHMEWRAKEIVKECGDAVIEARSTWNYLHHVKKVFGGTKGYDSLTHVEIGPVTVIVYTQNYCGEGNHETGDPITFPARWLDADSTHEARCAELRGWYADKAEQVARKKDAAEVRAATELEAAERATYERLQAKFGGS